MRRSTRKEYAKKGIIVLAMMSLMLGVTGCGKEEAGPTVDAQVSVEAENVEQQETEVEEMVEEVEETLDEVETTQEEVEVEPVVETPEVEMVDFETWAKQEGNDEVCLVHWNEELGIQEIMPTFDELNDLYEIQDGDRFAVPFNFNIEGITIYEGEKFIFENSEYVEIPLNKGVVTHFYIFYKDENGERNSLYYIFK